MYELIHGVTLVYADPADDLRVLSDFGMISRLSFGIGLLPWLNLIVTSRLGTLLIRRPKYNTEGKLCGIASVISQSRSAIASQMEKPLAVSQPSLVLNFSQVPSDKTSKMTTEQASAECTNLMFAGKGSTTAGLVAVLHELGTPQGREWQTRIFIDIADGSTRIPARLVAVIKETLRLHPPFSCGFPRYITPGAENAIPGIAKKLPLGTGVFCNLYVLGRSEELWGEDAHIWRPEHWLEAS